MSNRISCHYCRVYGGVLYVQWLIYTEREPSPTTLVDAKHCAGAYTWGDRAKRSRGRWVTICQACRDELARCDLRDE